MEGVLLAAVLVLTALVLLDLALTLAIVRRLRQQATTRQPVVDPHLAQLVGRPVPDLVAVTTDGTTLTADLLRDGSVFVAFVATGCDACHDDLPRLRRYVAARRAAGDAVLVVVDGRADDEAADDEMVSTLAGEAPVVVESFADDDRPFHEAFGVDSYPSYLVIEDGAVAQVYPSMSMVDVPVLDVAV